MRAPKQFKRCVPAQYVELARQDLLHALKRRFAAAELAQRQTCRDRIPVDTRLEFHRCERDQVVQPGKEDGDSVDLFPVARQRPTGVTKQEGASRFGAQKGDVATPVVIDQRASPRLHDLLPFPGGSRTSEEPGCRLLRRNRRPRTTPFSAGNE